jgi:hypothetical protein
MVALLAAIEHAWPIDDTSLGLGAGATTGEQP